MKEKLVKKKTRFLYSSIIRLGLAIGDWTKIRLSDNTENIRVSNVDQIAFDGLSKEKLHRLHHLHYLFAEKMTKQFSEDMNIKVDLHTIMVTQISYEDYLDSISDDVFQMDLGIKDVGNVSMLVGMNFVSLLMDRIFGGSGHNIQQNKLSDVEEKILSKEMNNLIKPFSDSWKNVFSVDDVDMKVNSGFKPDEMISPRESIVVFTFYLYFGSSNLLRIMVAYPSRTLRKMIRIKNIKPETIHSKIHLKKKTIDKTRYDVKAILGSSALTMNDIYSLEPGDIVPLDSGIDSSIAMNIGGKVNLKVQPCVHNKKVSCQILSADSEPNLKLILHTVDESEVGKVSIHDAADEPEDISASNVNAEGIIKKDALGNDKLDDNKSIKNKDVDEFEPVIKNEEGFDKELFESGEASDQDDLDSEDETLDAENVEAAEDSEDNLDDDTEDFDDEIADVEDEELAEDTDELAEVDALDDGTEDFEDELGDVEDEEASSDVTELDETEVLDDDEEDFDDELGDVEDENVDEDNLDEADVLEDDEADFEDELGDTETAEVDSTEEDDSLFEEEDADDIDDDLLEDSDDVTLEDVDEESLDDDIDWDDFEEESEE